MAKRADYRAMRKGTEHAARCTHRQRRT